MNHTKRTAKLGKIGLIGLGSVMVLACAGAAAGLPPDPAEYKSLAQYISALKTSTDPAAVSLVKQITAGPAALAAERAEYRKRGISLVEIRPVVPDSMNAYPVYIKWYDMHEGKPSSWMTSLGESMGPRLAFTPDQIAGVQKIFDDNPDVYNELHLAAGLPKYQLPVGIGDMTVSAHLREGAREIHAESYLIANGGDYSKAITVQALSLNIANQVRSGSAVGGFLQGSAIDGISYSGLQDIMTMAGPNPAIDEQVADTVRKALPSETLKDVLIAEIPEDLATINSTRSNTPSAIELGMEYLTGDFASQFGSMANDVPSSDHLFVNDLADAGEAHFLQQQLKAIDAASLTGAQRTAAFRAIDIQDHANPSDPASINPMAIYTYLDEDCNALKSKQQVILAAADVMEVKAKTGSFPKELPATFIDPFTGKPLPYETDGTTSCRIYSVGPTGKYDGKTRKFPEASFQYPAPPKQPVPDWLLK